MEIKVVHRRTIQAAYMIATVPCNLLMLARQPNQRAFLTAPSLINLFIGVASATLAAVVVNKKTNSFVEVRNKRDLIANGIFGALIGILVFALLSELVKQLQL